MQEACSPAGLMRKMMKKPMPSTQPWIRGWMKGVKREGGVSFHCWKCFWICTYLPSWWPKPDLHNRELREKEEIEKYRMERPKIQQQFSDLKVCIRVCYLNSTSRTTIFSIFSVWDAGLGVHLEVLDLYILGHYNAIKCVLRKNFLNMVMNTVLMLFWSI